MYVHKKAKLCFLASPRTASRAVREAICNPKVGFKQLGAHHDGPEQGYALDGYTAFCGVRNHWDTVISWWYNSRMNRKHNAPSIEWIAKHFSKNRYYFRAGTMFWFRHHPQVVTLRYENQEDELNVILREHGLPEVELPQFGVSKEREGRHYSEFYTSDTQNLVYWCFLKEIEELGYKFQKEKR